MELHEGKGRIQDPSGEATVNIWQREDSSSGHQARVEELEVQRNGQTWIYPQVETSGFIKYQHIYQEGNRKKIAAYPVNKIK